MRPMFLMIAILLSACVSKEDYAKLQDEKTAADLSVAALKIENKELSEELAKTKAALSESTSKADELQYDVGTAQYEALILLGIVAQDNAKFLRQSSQVTLCRYYGVGDHYDLPQTFAMVSGYFDDCGKFTSSEMIDRGYQVDVLMLDVDYAPGYPVSLRTPIRD